MSGKPDFKPTRWSLTDLFPALSCPELDISFQLLEEKTTAFEAYRSQLNADLPVENFLEIIHHLEEINDLAHRVNAFAALVFSEDTQNQAALSLLSRVEQLTADLTNQVLFFDLWWKSLDEKAAERLLSLSGDYRYWLEEMRHFISFTLTEPEEKVVNTKNVTGATALHTLYETITNRYTFKVKVEGKKRTLTRGELMVFARQHDPDLRAAAYQELYRIYGQDAPILGLIYQTLVRDWHNEQIAMRGFKTPIAARNLANDIPDAVIDTMLDVCRKNVSVFQRFFKAKSRHLGVDRLRRYDIYAPLRKADKKYTYSQAAGMVLDSFRDFDPGMADLASRVFDQDHLDSEVRQGKRSGAFCLTAVPKLTPWVLLNYQGKAEDVAVMAHELGHAIHAMLAGHHNVFTFHSSLPLAETASTFGEMMLLDRLLERESDDAVRRDMIFRQLDDAYATIQRQAFFALFERQAHEMVLKGASVDELGQAYLENLSQQFGDVVEVSDEFRWEWVSIPHIYNVPFYVYAYSFGQLLVLSLYQQYKKEGAAFKPLYTRMLSAGGSKSPMRVLADAGLKVQQADFWQGGFDIIDGLVRQLEQF